MNKGYISFLFTIFILLASDNLYATSPISNMFFGVTGIPSASKNLQEVDYPIIGKSVLVDDGSQATYVSLKPLATTNTRLAVKVRVVKGSANANLAMYEMNPDFSYGSPSVIGQDPVSEGVHYFEHSFANSSTGVSRGTLQLLPITSDFKAYVSLEYLPLVGNQRVDSSFVSTFDSNIVRFSYKEGDVDKPLVVSLHSYTGTYNSYNLYDSTFSEASGRGWSFISPDYRHSGTGKGTGHAAVIRDISNTIDWAKENLQFDHNRIYVVGGSGGGYTALAYGVSGARPIQGFASIVGFSDLLRWYTFNKLRVAELPDGFPGNHADYLLRLQADLSPNLRDPSWAARSPLYNATSITAPVYLRHGVNDNSVSPYQSIAFYNALAEANGDYANSVPTDMITEVYRRNRDKRGDESTDSFLTPSYETDSGPFKAMLELTNETHNSLVTGAFLFFDSLN